MFLEKIFFILLLLVYCSIVYNYSNNYIISQKKFTLFFHPSPIRNDLSIWLLQLSSFSAPAKQDSKGDGDPSYHEKQIRIHPKGRRHLLPGVPSNPPGIDEDRVPQKTRNGTNCILAIPAGMEIRLRTMGISLHRNTADLPRSLNHPFARSTSSRRK